MAVHGIRRQELKTIERNFKVVRRNLGEGIPHYGNPLDPAFGMRLEKFALEFDLQQDLPTFQAMEMRPVGQTGIDVAPLAFRGNVFGWTVSAEAAMRLFDAFIAEGFNLVDTADVYSRWVPVFFRVREAEDRGS